MEGERNDKGKGMKRLRAAELTIGTQLITALTFHSPSQLSEDIE
jgi:hypothetical protein